MKRLPGTSKEAKNTSPFCVDLGCDDVGTARWLICSSNQRFSELLHCHDCARRHNDGSSVGHVVLRMRRVAVLEMGMDVTELAMDLTVRAVAMTTGTLSTLSCTE